MRVSNQGRSALVVNDEEDIRKVIGIILAKDGFEMIKTGDGLEALEHLEVRHFDVVIIDSMMPRMNGVELFERIENRWPDLAECSIFINGSGSPSVLHFLRRVGNPVLWLPFTQDQLLAAVGSVLRR